MSIITPVVISGYLQWVHPWRVAVGQAVYLYGEDFDSPYCPVSFEVSNDSF